MPFVYFKKLPNLFKILDKIPSSILVQASGSDIDKCVYVYSEYTNGAYGVDFPAPL
jgi:hypothetical protein